MINRREFVGAMATASLAGVLGKAGPNDRIRIGLIGSGSRGRSVMNGFRRFAEVEIPVICDVIEPRMEEAAASLTKGPGTKKPDLVVDYRRILDRKDIDAVIIATTEHWHGLPAIHAAQAGKAFFVEKPLAHTVAEGRAIVDAAKKHGVLAMMGTQQRGGTHYQQAIEIVQAGRLGKISLVKCWNFSNSRQRLGRPPDSDPPPGYHWDLWLGPAKFVPFNPARLRHTSWFDYGGGMVTVWGVHHVDIILAAMRAEAPKSVVCSGGKFIVDDLADAPDTVEASWIFSNFMMQYMYRGTNSFPIVPGNNLRHGISFHGTDGTLVVDRRGYEIWSDAPTPSSELEPPVANKIETVPAKAGEQDRVWQRSFLDCLRDRKAPPVDLETSHKATACCQLANIAYHTGRRIHWDGAKQQIAGDQEASRLLERPRRKGYELPKV